MPTGVSAMTAIGAVTLSATATDVTFTIPSGYRDLEFVYKGNTSSAGEVVYLQFNGDTGANYSTIWFDGDGSGASSSAASSQTSGRIGTNYSGQGMIRVMVFDYAETNKHKTLISRSDAASNVIVAQTTRWSSTSAITSVRFFLSASTFASGSTFTCYGVSA